MTSWLEHYGKPLAASAEEAAAFLTKELEAAVPDGWSVRRVEGRDLAWTIGKTGVSAGAPPMTDFGVQLTGGLDFVLFTHGNTDAGPLDLKDFLLQALVIDSASLRHFGVGRCLEHPMSGFEPNRWGYT